MSKLSKLWVKIKTEKWGLLKKVGPTLKFKYHKYRRRLRAFAAKQLADGKALLARLKNTAEFLSRKKIKNPTISVIVPTYTKNEYFDRCIASLKEQTFPQKDLKIILAFNGNDMQYYKYLCDRFASDENVIVYDTKGKGLSHARNSAIEIVTTDYVTYLDDDDFFTPGFLKEMASKLREGITMVCGRLVDYSEKNDTYNSDTYINATLKNVGTGMSDDYFRCTSFLSLFCEKLYKTTLIRDNFSRFDETLAHTEDIIFWCENFGNMTGSIFVCNHLGKEAYVRRLTDNSMSRPQTADSQFKFYISDRIKIISRLSALMFEPSFSLLHKQFLMVKINAQTNHMLAFYEQMDKADKERAFEEIKNCDAFYFNKSLFAKKRAIAFCHNFAPWADASAYVATKRLGQIAKLEGEPLRWNIISANMGNCRNADRDFIEFYARYCYEKVEMLPGKTYFNEKAQWLFGERAFEQKKDCEAEVIYSRSSFAGSHVAAYKYKQAHPKVKWYAEFSDPLYKGTDNIARKSAKQYEGDEEFLNTFWRDIELMVYELADVVIYTNDNQRTYMLDYVEDKELCASVMQKSIVINHPILDSKFANILPHKLSLDKSKINIGYFGTFYANRTYDEMLNLLCNEQVVLHVFTSATKETVEELEKKGGGRIVVSGQVSHLQFLNVASQLDYVYLNDVDFDGELIPYLPSKYADYLSSGTKIIAKVNSGSPLSTMENEQLLKTPSISKDFALKLKK